jgi:small subunit ribosomal protein S16
MPIRTRSEIVLSAGNDSLTLAETVSCFPDAWAEQSMALRIVMSRDGAKKRPFYRIVVADYRAPRDGRFIEKIGFHNPMMPRDDEARLHVDLERAKHWLSVGAKPSDRVMRFLSDVGVINQKEFEHKIVSESFEDRELIWFYSDHKASTGSQAGDAIVQFLKDLGIEIRESSSIPDNREISEEEVESILSSYDLSGQN